MACGLFFFFAVERDSQGRNDWDCDETNVCKKEYVV